jgi:phosphoenolpyruvate synthase/pyruvate phosphate dikinase
VGFILESHETVETIGNSGGERARLLAEVQGLGAPVPEWFCVSYSAMERFLRGNVIDTFLATIATLDQSEDSLKDFAKEAEKRILGSSVSPEVARAIDEKMLSLGLTKSHVTIRASWLGDLPINGPQFAHQVSKLDVLIALRKAWASAYSFESLQIRKALGLSLWPALTGVIVQKSLNAHSSGLAFANSENEIEVHASWGAEHGTEDEMQQVRNLISHLEIRLGLKARKYGFEWAMDAERLLVLQAFPHTLAAGRL